MDGMHDLGGMETFGPIAVQHDYQAFETGWEGRMWAVAHTAGAADWTIDWFRHLIECLDPQTYLTITYFEKWAMACATGFVMSGVFTIDEIIAGTTGERKAPPDPVPLKEVLAAVRANSRSFARPCEDEPAFQAGQAVRAESHGRPHHTRLPRYLRGREGTILAHHGGHVFPDDSAKGRATVQHLYTVVFTARELWGETAPETDTVRADLWESYLVPA